LGYFSRSSSRHSHSDKQTGAAEICVLGPREYVIEWTWRLSRA